MTPCPQTGVLLPNCGCRACNLRQVAFYAPHLLTATGARP